MQKFGIGKYRNIIVSVALFLLLDASVLLTNFYMSFQISEDATAVNLAGRQRMLSQRIMKSLLETDVSLFNSDARQNALDELQRSVNLFDNTLKAFKNGGVTTDANGFPVQLNPADPGKAQNALNAADEIWRPFLAGIKLLLLQGSNIDNPNFTARLQDAVQYGTANNLELLRLMNELTVALEDKATAKASRLRMIQTVGMSLAILNFLLILFHFLKQLKQSDAIIEQSRQETEEILETVNEGLFLLDEHLTIGQQYSKKLTQIFHREDIAGTSFQSLLKSLISEKDMSTAESFIKLLFKPTVNQKLIGELNPLNEIEIHIADDNGQYQSKFLNFQFSRVVVTGTISHVLATVSDITRQVMLSRDLDNARRQSESQMELLSTIMHANGDLMPMFVRNSVGSLEKINNILKLPSRSHVQHMGKVHQIYALIHGFKGEATSLGLTPFAELAHKFEDQLEALATNENLTGNDFLSLTVLLNQILRQLDAAEKLLERLAKLSQVAAQPEIAEKPDWTHFQNLADDMAQRQGKEVEIVCSGLNDYPLPAELASTVNRLCIQFIRNAISHGIETVQDRMDLQKTPRSEINIHFCRLRSGHWRLTVQDDGAGINTEQIRLKAIQSGLVTEQQSELMSQKQLIALIFSPTLSTQSAADMDAGRGMGMTVIRDLVKDQGGKINVATRAHMGSTFTITLPAATNLATQAA
ncbi:ATP-binding protein [Reinekea sp. G2M2-21]|uniref:type IV pili methyl-accepting chemotaxis transducer N-terminal domain-containing protein n=1 Tax=Reinekea sp. G2M2-21 TaxID=2788942 RepID=UPI0018ABCD9A|nr:ATP-binding protein [Reinekea sp. G2M2-21]